MWRGANHVNVSWFMHANGRGTLPSSNVSGEDGSSDDTCAEYGAGHGDCSARATIASHSQRKPLRKKGQVR